MKLSCSQQNSINMPHRVVSHRIVFKLDYTLRDLCVCVCLFVFGHLGELCKTAELIEMPFGGWLMCVSNTMYYMFVEITTEGALLRATCAGHCNILTHAADEYNLLAQGVTKRRCGLLPNYFGYLLNFGTGEGRHINLLRRSTAASTTSLLNGVFKVTWPLFIRVSEW